MVGPCAVHGESMSDCLLEFPVLYDSLYKSKSIKVVMEYSRVFRYY